MAGTSDTKNNNLKVSPKDFLQFPWLLNSSVARCLNTSLDVFEINLIGSPKTLWVSEKNPTVDAPKKRFNKIIGF